MKKIWHLQKESHHLCLKIYSIGTSFGLPAYGDSLAQKVRKIAPDVSADIDPCVFAQSVFQAFKAYKFGDMFAQWQSSGFKNYFPEEEYQTLRKLLRNTGGHL